VKVHGDALRRLQVWKIVKLLSRDAGAIRRCADRHAKLLKAIAEPFARWGGLFISMEFASFGGPGPIYLNEIICRPRRRLFWIRAGAIDLGLNRAVFRPISKWRAEPSIGWRFFEACAVPQPSGDNERIKLDGFPPCCFVAAAMEDTMVDATERNRELVADPPAQCPRLCKSQMVGVGRPSCCVSIAEARNSGQGAFIDFTIRKSANFEAMQPR
jgi:hypothetical protein